MKKGQAAMEFLMTYGWAILAAIIVIGILGYYYFSTGLTPANNETCGINGCAVAPAEFCMAAVPNYLLDCKSANGTTMIVRADINTIGIALAKNNCTIMEEADQIEIGYCGNMKVNETLPRWKIHLEEYQANSTS